LGCAAGHPDRGGYGIHSGCRRQMVKEYTFRLKAAHITREGTLTHIHIFTQEGDYLEIITGEKSGQFLEAHIIEAPCA
jgi:hypothetical protein